MKKILAIIVLAEALDFITTVIGLRLGFYELNPLLGVFGWTNLSLIKILGTAFIVLVLILGYGYLPRFTIIVGIIVTIIAILPVINNTILILFY